MSLDFLLINIFISVNGHNLGEGKWGYSRVTYSYSEAMYHDTRKLYIWSD